MIIKTQNPCKSRLAPQHLERDHLILASGVCPARAPTTNVPPRRFPINKKRTNKQNTVYRTTNPWVDRFCQTKYKLNTNIVKQKEH